MVRSARGMHRREEILRAAGGLFSLRGYFHTSTNDILEAVAISKGAFYYYFRSKEELVVALLEELRKAYEQEVIAYVDDWEEVGERPTVLLDKLVELNASGRWYHCVLLARLAMESSQYGHDLSEQINETVGWLTEMYGKFLAEAQAVGSVRDDISADELAEFIVSAMFGAIICRELGNDMAKLGRIAEMLKKFMGLTRSGEPMVMNRD